MITLYLLRMINADTRTRAERSTRTARALVSVLALVVSFTLTACQPDAQTSPSMPHTPGKAHATITTADPHHGSRITEDDPRWNCRTMGNHECGARATITTQREDPRP